MHLRIEKMQFLFGFIVILCWHGASVSGLAAEQCLRCDSANENEKDCGFVKESANPTVETCASSLGCYAKIYLKEDDAYPGYYTSRGCLNEGDERTSDMEVCSENDCNVQVFPGDRHKCMKCVDDSCSSTISRYCSIYLRDSYDCVTIFNEDGSIFLRDCYSDVPDTLRDQCDNSNYLDCKKCTGQNCNTVTVREGTKCFKCEGASCLIIDSTFYLEDCESPCYIGMNSNGEPVRGCSSDFANAATCSTNEASTADCFICRGDGCNAIIYPTTGRLQCHTCTSGECTEPSENDLQYCSTYSRSEQCVSVFSTTQDVIVERGCVSSLSAEQKQVCDSNSANCLKCSYNKCNKDDSKLKTEFCIECNSLDDPDCVKANPIFESRCSTNQCYTRLVASQSGFGSYIDRGCLADVTDCVDSNCESCTGKNCNRNLFPANRNSCKSCQFDDCVEKEIDKVCSLYEPNESCVTIFGEKKKVLLKDCYADVAAGTRQVCDDSSDLQCSKCQGNLCNIDNQRRGNKCYKCEGPECLHELGDTFDCQSKCFIGVNSLGYPKKDCASAIEGSRACGSTDQTCMTCNGDYCNGNVFPIQNRLTCQKCVGIGCSDPSSEYCQRLNSTETCVTIFDHSGAVIERGCSSTLQYSCGSDGNCLTCSFDNCNVANTLSEAYLCVSCKSEEEGNCVSSPTSTQAVGCTANQCYTKLLAFNGVGQHIQRGCAAGVQCSGSTCSLCSGELCNSFQFPSDRHSCYYCSGDTCASGHRLEKLCTLHSQSSSCLTVYGNKNEVVYRDCMVDASEGTRAICNDSNDLTCSSCTGKLCNNDSKRKGIKCLKCEGLDCFRPDYPADSVDCLNGGCYVGINSAGETKRDCSIAIANTSSCTSTDTGSASCLVCQDDLCNAIAFSMKSRLICKDCLGEACENNNLEEKYCESLSSNERCVSVFDSAGKIHERGCSSTVQNTALCNSSDSSCLKCAFNSCNVQASPSELYHCVSCNSKDNPNCVMNSTSVATKSCATNSCYSRLLSVESGSPWQYVEKGCAAELPTSLNCTGLSCSTCSGNRCNNIVYPSNRLSCLTCRNDECKQATIPSETCMLHSDTLQGCITLYDTNNEVFHRGCYSDAAEGTKKVCDDTSDLLCTKCSSSNCNRDTQRRGHKCFKCEGIDCFQPVHPADVVDCLSYCYVGINELGENIRGCASAFANTTACGDDNGVNRCNICSDDLCNGVQFPMVKRLQCHTCVDENCEPTIDNLQFCELYNEQERCVTVLSIEDKVVERGCSSGLRNQRYCNQNYESCLKCSTNGCNVETSRANRMCIVCDSKSDPNCVLNPSVMPTAICALGCYTRLVNGTLYRGCSDDLAVGFSCTSSNNCQFCNDAHKCNIINYPADRRSCKTCVGIANCLSSISQPCINYNQNESCATVFSNYAVSHKGCLSDLPAVSQAICANSTNNQCLSCSSRNNCNTDTTQRDERCLICNSALDPECSQSPERVRDQQCSIPSKGQCYSRIKGGATDRGCLGSLTSPDECRNNTADNCYIYSGQGSNNKIIPDLRLKCYHCDSRFDKTCFEAPKGNVTTLPCKMFVQPENCLKLELNDGAIIRGCSADFSSEICKLGTCHECRNKDGCNKATIRSVNVRLTGFLLILLFSLFRTNTFTTSI